MPALRTLALTVHELEQGEFHWLLMETQSPPDLKATQPYLPLAAGERPHASYRTALLEGMGTLRRMAGMNGPRGC